MGNACIVLCNHFFQITIPNLMWHNFLLKFILRQCFALQTFSLFCIFCLKYVLLLKKVIGTFCHTYEKNYKKNPLKRASTNEILHWIWILV